MKEITHREDIDYYYHEFGTEIENHGYRVPGTESAVIVYFTTLSYDRQQPKAKRDAIGKFLLKGLGRFLSKSRQRFSNWPARKPWIG